MQIETFECHETAAEPIEASEEAIGIIESLNLRGQANLITSPAAGQKADRCPYREMTADEVFVYRTLCPTEYKIEEYAVSTLPLRVLQIAAHAQSLGIFKRLAVWDRQSASVVDPVLVAFRQDSTNTWREIPFILARWGSELEAFVVLLKKAVAMSRDSRKATLRSIQARVQSEIALVDTASDSEVVSRGISTPYFNA